MKNSLLTRAALLSSPLWAFLACSLGVEDFAGKTCNVTADCPASYSCVESAPLQRTCELIQQPLTDAGQEPVTEPADWCNDVKPLMVKYCVECHGPTPQQGAPAGFRLDQYEGATPGAFAKADRIKANFNDEFGTGSAMPPPSYATQPIREEAEVVRRWYGVQAPRVLDGRPDCQDPP